LKRRGERPNETDLEEVVVMISNIVAATVVVYRQTGMLSALRSAGMIICILLLASMTGCAPKIYNVNMRYQPTKVIPPSMPPGKWLKAAVRLRDWPALLIFKPPEAMK
jgi:hypothetical protein